MLSSCLRILPCCAVSPAEELAKRTLLASKHESWMLHPDCVCLRPTAASREMFCLALGDGRQPSCDARIHAKPRRGDAAIDVCRST